MKCPSCNSGELNDVTSTTPFLEGDKVWECPNCKKKFYPNRSQSDFMKLMISANNELKELVK